MIRILKITGWTAAGRAERLERIRTWMTSRGWRLTDYAEEARSAMFERPEDAPRLPAWDATRWLPGPAPWRPGEWWHTVRADPRLVVVPGVIVGLLVVLGLALFAPPSVDVEQVRREEAAKRWFQVDASQLNVREAPHTGAQIVGVLYRDQRVQVEGEVDGAWVRIDIPARGYVARSYLRPGTPPAE